MKKDNYINDTSIPNKKINSDISRVENNASEPTKDIDYVCEELQKINQKLDQIYKHLTELDGSFW